MGAPAARRPKAGGGGWREAGNAGPRERGDDARRVRGLFDDELDVADGMGAAAESARITRTTADQLRTDHGSGSEAGNDASR